MQKPTEIILKKPWIPPPAKTSRKLKRTLPIKNPAKPSPEDNCEEKLHEKDAGQEILEDNLPVSEEADKEVDLHDLHNHLVLMRTHCYHLTSVSEFLVRSKPPKVESAEEDAILTVISKCDIQVKEFVSSLDELEDLLSTEKDESEEPKRSLDAYKYVKNGTIEKVLNAYESSTTALKSILSVQKTEDIQSLLKEHGALKKRVEDVHNHFVSRGSELLGLEKELTLTQIHKKSLEAQIIRMEAELSHKEARIEQLKLNLESQTHLQKGVAENERLIEVIEEMQYKAEAEKAALKKALRLQKVQTEQSEDEILHLQSELKAKERMCYDLASDRDHWKSELTALNNKFIESENGRQSIEMKYLKLESQLKEMKVIQSRVNKAIANSDATDSSGGLKENTSVNVNSSPNGYKLSHVEKKAKEQLNEAKETYQEILQRNFTNSAFTILESNLKDLQEKYSVELKEKERLHKRIEALESQLFTRKFNGQFDDGDSQIQTYIKNTFLPSHPEQGHSDEITGKQVLGVHERSKDSESNLFVIQLQEELKTQGLKISLLEKAKLEAERRCGAQVKELQDNLDRLTMNYQSLQKYVQLLKSSYTNVFGTT